MTSELLQNLEENVSLWPGVSSHPHRFGGREFSIGTLEIGHTHADGTIDIPFPRPLHDELLAEGLAEQHQWVPDSGWTTFRLRSCGDITQALQLLRLSYLRYVLKAVPDPGKRFESETAKLQVSLALRLRCDLPG